MHLKTGYERIMSGRFTQRWYSNRRVIHFSWAAGVLFLLWILYLLRNPALSRNINGSPDKKKTLSWRKKLPREASWKSLNRVIRYFWIGSTLYQKNPQLIDPSKDDENHRCISLRSVVCRLKGIAFPTSLPNLTVWFPSWFEGCKH